MIESVHTEGRSIADRVAPYVVDLSRIGPVRWCARHVNGGERPCEVAYDDPWLVVDFAVAPAEVPATAWDAIRVGAGSPSPLKLLAALDGRPAALRAEILLDDEDADDRIAAAFAAQPSALAMPGPSAAGASDVGDPGLWDALLADATLAPWAPSRRGDGSAGFALRVPGSTAYNAVVRALGDGELFARAELARVRGVSKPVTRALGHFLAAATRRCRRVRFVRVARDDVDILAAEAVASAAGGAGDLHGALEALAVACRATGREVAALRDPRIASAYLAACAPDVAPRANASRKARCLPVQEKEIEL